MDAPDKSTCRDCPYPLFIEQKDTEIKRLRALLDCALDRVKRLEAEASWDWENRLMERDMNPDFHEMGMW